MNTRETTPMVMQLIAPVFDHNGKPVRAFHSRDAAWKNEGLAYIVLVQRGDKLDTYTIPVTNVRCVAIYNADVAQMAEENARRQEAARQVLETPDPGDLQ